MRKYATKKSISKYLMNTFFKDSDVFYYVSIINYFIIILYIYIHNLLFIFFYIYEFKYFYRHKISQNSLFRAAE